MTIARAFQVEIYPGQGQTARQCLAAATAEFEAWVREPYRQDALGEWHLPFDGSTVSPRQGHEIRSEVRECATHALATINWEFEDKQDTNVLWHASCALACDGQLAQAAAVVEALSRAFVLRQLAFRLSTSNPAAKLAFPLCELAQTFTCRVGGLPVPLRAPLLRINDVERFVRKVLLNPERVLPVFLLGPGAPVPVADADLQRLQRTVFGHAQVAALANRPAAQRLTAVLGPERSLEGVVARMYWPGFTRDAPPEAHPAKDREGLAKTLVNETLSQQLMREFSAISAERFREGWVIRAARAALAVDEARRLREAADAARRVAAAEAEQRRAVEAQERLRLEAAAARGLVQNLRNELAEARGRLEALRQLPAPPPAAPPDPTAEELAAELERAWDENERLREEWGALRRQVDELEAALRAYRENWALLREQPAPPPVAAAAPPPDAERPFESVAAALAAAGQEFADVLVVWEDATQSAERSLYSSPAKVFRALRAVAEVGRDYFRARAGGPPLGPLERAFAARVPFKYAGFESRTTLGLYGAERVFHHGEQSRQMQRHLTLGGGATTNCLQIYFEFDDDARRVLIGYCGRHLPFCRQRT
jgi:hypothetical protein